MGGITERNRSSILLLSRLRLKLSILRGTLTAVNTIQTLVFKIIDASLNCVQMSVRAAIIIVEITKDSRKYKIDQTLATARINQNNVSIIIP